MYRRRMLGYYPPVVQAIKEIESIVDCEYPEFESISAEKKRVTKDAYLLTMGEERITEWEQILGIKPLEGSSTQDRRDNIIARIRGQGKLNSALISSIVNAFTGGTAESYIRDSVLHVEITPPKDNKTYQFTNVIRELSKVIPAHLGLEVVRKYATWGEVKESFTSWEDIKRLANWEELAAFVVD